MKDFKRLIYLKIRDNPVANIDFVLNMKKLKKFIIEATNVDSIKLLENNENIEWIGLVRNPIMDYSPIYEMKKLKHLIVDEKTCEKLDIDKLKKKGVKMHLTKTSKLV